MAQIDEMRDIAKALDNGQVVLIHNGSVGFPYFFKMRRGRLHVWEGEDWVICPLFQLAHEIWDGGRVADLDCGEPNA